MSADMRLSDESIDDTARSLTEGQPASGFKARVLAKVEASETSRGLTWRPVAVASAAIAIISFVVISRQGTEVPPNAPTAAEVRLPPVPSAVEGSSPLPGSGVPEKGGATGVTETPDVRSGMDSEMTAMENAPASIAVAEIEMRSLEIAALEQLDFVVTTDLPIDSIELPTLESTTAQFD
jgi:hypothetical protein